jgi:3-oxoacyl-[acyl-carrier-protein] synthase-3
MDSQEKDAALVISSEAMSQIVDWTDRSTCVLFGDGAGAVVLKRSEQPRVHFPIISGSPDKEDVIICKRELRKTPFNNIDEQEAKQDHLRMNGREVFTYAVSAADTVLHKLLIMCKDKPFTKVIPHQANAKIIDYVKRKLRFKQEQFFLDIDEYANTSSATIPIAMYDAYRQGWLKKGDRVALVSFGSGLTCGGIVVDWTI